MDRDTVSDRLPFGRIPGLGTDTEATVEQPASDTGGVDSADTDSDIEADPIEIDLDGPEDTPSRRARVRKALMGVSLGGLGLAALAALLWRLLGGSDSEDDADGEDEPASGAVETEASQDEDAAEPDSEPAAEDEVDIASELLTADAEGVAALIGLGFQLLVRALVGEDGSESPTA